MLILFDIIHHLEKKGIKWEMHLLTTMTATMTHQTPGSTKIATFCVTVCGCPWKKSLPRAVGCCCAVAKVFQHISCLSTCLHINWILCETRCFLHVVICHSNKEKKSTRDGQLSYESSHHYSRNEGEQVTWPIFMDVFFLISLNALVCQKTRWG